MDLIEAKPKHFASWSYELFIEGSYLTTIDMAWITEGGSFDWKGHHYSLCRESLMSGQFMLKEDSREIASATKPNPFTRKYNLLTGDRNFTLSVEGAFSRAFELSENGEPTGHITPLHPFSRKCTVDLPQDLSIPVRIFMLWLVILLWRRHAHAVATRN